jgi:UPF0716 protein FxsA
MFKVILSLFILVPIIEIMMFIEVGGYLGLGKTLFIVLITAIVGVNLLKQQGFKAWQSIQLSIAEGKVPALEMASAAQLLFAGGLLLTPGFVTDAIGFVLMIPAVRMLLAKKIIAGGLMKSASFNVQAGFSNVHSSTHSNNQSHSNTNHSSGRTFEGEIIENDAVQIKNEDKGSH